MTNVLSRSARDTGQGGYVLGLGLRVVLMLLVLGQIVFLASRYRSRVDATKDGLYTLTDSTVQVLSNLDRRLVIEAYFSGDETLGPYREYRRMLDNFLEELVQVSGGKIVIDRLNPQDDLDVKNQAERLGIRAMPLQDVGDASLSVNQVWNGLRMLYGGDRQSVVPFLGLAPYPMGYEIQLTPRIKALTVPEKPVIGLIAYGTQAVVGSRFGAGGNIPSMGYQQLRNYVGDRYNLLNVDITKGQLISDKIDTVFLIRPKNLTAREKYSLDQFLMRGGSLVVFVDTDEVEIGAQRLFRRKQIFYDVPGDPGEPFLDQLAHYGVDVQEKVIADFAALLGPVAPDAVPTAQFMVQGRTLLGASLVPLDVYPYWFHAANVDYPALAEAIAGMQPGDDDVAEVAARYADLFEPGVDMSNVVVRSMGRGPSMFWPCPVDLADELPDGVEGKVLMRTSPLAYAETPPDSFNPFGRSQEMQKAAYVAFRNRKLQKLQSEPRQQFGLMVHLKGTFSSFFEGKQIPGRFQEENDQPLLVPDPLAEPIVETPGQPAVPTEGEGEGKGEEQGETAPKEQAQEGEEGGGAGVAPEPDFEDAPRGPNQMDGEPVASNALGAQAQDKEADPDPVWKSPPEAQLIVVGDADFLRDDLRAIQGRYGPQSVQHGPLGPMSILGPTFFTNMVDWLSEDEDLLALRNISPTNRSLNFASEGLESGSDEFLADIKARERQLSFMVVGGPVVAILVVWLVAIVRRRARKQAFLSSVGA